MKINMASKSQFRGMHRVVLTAAIAVSILATMFAGIGYAYWRTAGVDTGFQGGATAAAPAAVTIAPTAAVVGLLQPNSTGDLVMSVTNTNSFGVSLTGLSLVSATAAGCTDPKIVLTTPQTYLPASIPANASGVKVTLPGAVTMQAGATSDCQNKTFTLALAPTVEK